MLKPLTPEAIGQDYNKELSVQDYSKKTVIDGVQLINLNMFVDDGGSLAEIVRFDDNGCLQILPEFKASMDGKNTLHKFRIFPFSCVCCTK